jgi:hypothetical protein
MMARATPSTARGLALMKLRVVIRLECCHGMSAVRKSSMRRTASMLSDETAPGSSPSGRARPPGQGRVFSSRAQ